MKIKNILKTLLIAGPATFLVVSCGDSFLDTPLQNAITNDLLGESEAGVDASLISTYKMLNGFTNQIGNVWGAAPSNYIFNSASDDQHKGSEPSDNPDGYSEVGTYQWAAGLRVFSQKYTAVYEGVVRANNTIKLANTLKTKGTSTDAFYNRVVGESTFLRAWYHFEAYKVFKNVPYYTEEDPDFKKSNDKDVLPLIVADLNKAIELLPANKGSVGRVDKNVAQALLGKVKLYQKDFAGAKAAFDLVVGSGKYSLAPCYNDNFTISGQNGPESIFAFQASANDGDGNASNANFLERLAAPHTGSHTGCCGFNNPTQDLANSYRVDANGLPVKDWNSKTLLVSTADEVDPRLDWTMGRTGVPYLDWGLHSDGWIRGSGWAGLFSPKKNMKLTTDASAGGWNTNQLHAKNVELIRYADVLLMLAEAEVEAGSLERARELVNLVRKRAGKCAQGPVGGALTVPINDPSITWAKYKVAEYTGTWTNKDDARDAVRRERRLELATEGHRIFDLRRWGVLENTINTFRAYESKVVNTNGIRTAIIDGAGAVGAKHYAFPLPSLAVDISEGRIKQNEGF